MSNIYKEIKETAIKLIGMLCEAPELHEPAIRMPAKLPEHASTAEYESWSHGIDAYRESCKRHDAARNHKLDAKAALVKALQEFRN